MGYDGKHCGEIEMANKIVREIIHAKGIDIGIYTKNFENEYISLTDIAKYVKEKYGVNVHTSYIAQVKRMCGLDMGENYNKSKKENPEVKQCPQEKVEYIKDALRHFKLI